MNSFTLLFKDGELYPKNEKTPITDMRYFFEKEAKGYDSCLVYMQNLNNLKVLENVIRDSDLSYCLIYDVKHIDEAKKLLYIGADLAFKLNENNHELFLSLFKRFGRERIRVFFESEENLKRHIGYIKGLNPRVILEKNLFNAYEGDIQIFNEDDKIIKVGFENYIPFNKLKLNSDGLIPCIVQDWVTNKVIMLAYMNEEAYNMTMNTRIMTYYSRSRQQLWIKGETSHHYQYLKEFSLDCDGDTLLAKVRQMGVGCHTGSYSCFFNTLYRGKVKEQQEIERSIERAYSIILDRRKNPKDDSYTTYLFREGLNKILKKMGEEAIETVIAAKSHDNDELCYEIADLLYHVLVLCANQGLDWQEVLREMSNR